MICLTVAHYDVLKDFLKRRSTLEKTIRCDILPCVNLKVIFRIKNRLSSKFTSKDKILKEMHSSCSSSYNATYNSKTKCNFKVRVYEHMAVSARTDKNIKSTKDSAVQLRKYKICEVKFAKSTEPGNWVPQSIIILTYKGWFSPGDKER